jgi:hypothetical protein
MPTTNDQKSLKKLRCIQRSADRHWVGSSAVASPALSMQNALAGSVEQRHLSRLDRLRAVHAPAPAQHRERRGVAVGHCQFRASIAREMGHLREASGTSRRAAALARPGRRGVQRKALNLPPG